MRDPAQQMSDVTTEAAVVAGLAWAAQSLAERSATTASGKAVLIRDNEGGESVALIDEEAAACLTPGRIIQRVTLETEESLTDYAKRYQGASSLILASIESNTIVAVLDYHEARANNDGEVMPLGDLTHQFGDHVATLALPYSLEWKEWMAMDGRMVPQLELCKFLEECSEDIKSPAAATVIEACRDLQSLKRVDFRSVVRQDSDNYRIEYHDEDAVSTRNESVTLPSEIVLGLPVYFGGEEVEVHALIRWHVKDGALSLGVKLKRAERIRQAVFKGIVDNVAAETGFPRVYGSLASR